MTVHVLDAAHTTYTVVRFLLPQRVPWDPCHRGAGSSRSGRASSTAMRRARLAGRRWVLRGVLPAPRSCSCKPPLLPAPAGAPACRLAVRTALQLPALQRPAPDVHGEQPAQTTHGLHCAWPPQVNYLRGRLRDAAGQQEGAQRAAHANTNSALPQGTLGTLDLGGSSLEVVREQPGAAAAGDAAAHTHSITLGAHSYQLQTQTYHRFGMGDTFKRSVQLLLQQHAAAQGVAVADLGMQGRPEVQLDHPCLQQGQCW
jgi:hypothetical protein